MPKLSPVYFILDLYAGSFKWITAQTFQNLMEMEPVSYNPSDFLELNELGAQSQILFGAFYGDCAHTHVE